jgi:hypothetical protein
MNGMICRVVRFLARLSFFTSKLYCTSVPPGVLVKASDRWCDRNPIYERPSLGQPITLMRLQTTIKERAQVHNFMTFISSCSLLSPSCLHIKGMGRDGLADSGAD